MSQAPHTADTARAIYPSLADKRVIVTGGGSGIGAALVEAFARQGAQVTFVDIATQDSERLVEDLGSSVRHPPIFHRLDLTDLGALQNFFAMQIERLGGVDILLNNAANDDRHTIDSVTPAYWEDRMNVNLRHLFFAAQAVVPTMRMSGGVILNFGSISWHLGLADMILYQTAKAGIEGMTRSLARDLGRSNIRCNAIIPGSVQTPRQEKWYSPEGEAEIVASQCLNGRIQPEDVAALALFLASDDARMCTGHNYLVDAGWR